MESAYRSAKVNQAVGGVTNSAHALGFAADFVVAEMTPLAVARKLSASKLVFDQLILERQPWQLSPLVRTFASTRGADPRREDRARPSLQGCRSRSEWRFASEDRRLAIQCGSALVNGGH